MDPYDPKRDLYVVLGVADDATAEDVKRTHRRKMKLVHPDGHRDPALATSETQALNEAYAVLGDPARRLAYNAKRDAFRSREQEAEITRRVAEALTRARAPGVKARAPGVKARAPGVKARAPGVKVAHVPAAPTVQQRTTGVFERLAQPKVEELVRQNQRLDAAVWGVGSILLDSWLGTGPKRKPPPRPARPRRR